MTNHAHTPFRILALGDSLTAGFLIPPGSAYPEVLARLLKQDGLPVRVANHGVCGDTCPDALARLDPVLRQCWDAALVGLGVNDVLQGRPTESIRSDLRRIATRLQNAGAATVLLGMRLPPAWSAGPLASVAEDFQSLYPELAEELGLHLLPDFLGPALEQGLLLDDGLHPTAAGMEAMAAALAPTVKALVRPAR